MLGLCNGGSIMKKLRLLTTLLAAAALSGCATYDYAGGSAPGGYYYGRASSGAGYGYGPYYDGYGYPSYGYGGGGYGYGYGGGYYNPYYGYGGYYPYRPYHPHRPRPPRPEEPGDGRAPPWRNPQDGRYRESGRVMIPPGSRVPQVPGQPQVIGGGRPAINNPGVRQRPESGQGPQRMSQPSAPRSEPRVERSRPVERSAPPPRSENRDRVRNQEP